MRNVCGCRHFCIFEIICELLQPFWKISQTVFSLPHRCPSFFCFELLVDRAGFPVPRRHFALLLDLKMFLMSPAVAMQKTSWRQNLTTIPGQQEVRNLPSCMNVSSLVWSTVAFDRWPTHTCNRALRRALQAMGLQACPRVTALLRRDQDRKHFPVLPSFACTSSLAVTTVVAFVDYRRVSSSSELKSFLLSMCIDAPESTTNSRSSGIFRRGCQRCPFFGRRVERSFDF